MATQKKFIADLGFETPSDLTVNGNATIDGNATVTGNLTVNGTSTTVNSTTTSVTDSMIELANANTGSDTLDIGIYGNYDDGLSDGGASEYTGLFRDASDSTWKLFDGLESEPTTTVNIAGTGYAKAALEVGDLSCTTLTATNSMTGASLSYPTSDGSAGQVIKTDGNGTLSFTTISGYTDSDVETYLNTSTIYTDPTNNRLGIGTSSPDVALDISQTSARVKIQDETNQLNIGLWDGTNHRIEGDSNRKLLITSYHTDGIHLGGSGNSHLVIKGGNIGIGQTSPNAKLDVKGDYGSPQALISSSDGDGLYIHAQGGPTHTNWCIGQQKNMSGLEFTPSTVAGGSTFSTPAMVIKTTGEVGIGTSAPDDLLHVYAGDSGAAPHSISAFNIESASNVAMNFLTPNTSQAQIRWADPQDDGKGIIGYDHNGDYMFFATNGPEKMRLDASGNLGVGHLSPQFRITLPQASDDSGKIGWEDGSENKRASILCNSSNDRLEFRTGTSDTLRMSIHGTNEDIHIGEGTSDVLLYIGSQGGAYGGNNSNWIRGSGGALMYNSGNGSHIWEATGSQKMQLKNDGTLLINRTSSFGSLSSASMIVTGQSASCAYWTAPNTAGYDIHTFFNGGLGVIGVIEQNSSLNGVSYNTSSDYRLKENVNDNWDATTILKQLRPVEYNFISDPNDTYQQGFIAHELAEHLPFAVSGEKDAVIPAVLYQETDQEVIDGEALVGDIKEEEKIKPQQVDYSKVVALLVKTIQELEARIATLESA